MPSPTGRRCVRARPIASVVIPCFNAIATIGAAIESALEQRDIQVEVIVVDDGSTDNSLAVARYFNPRVRVLSGPNKGVSAARNRGIAEAAAAWIIFLDADDLLTCGTLRRRLETAEATGADVVVCDWQELLDPGGRTVDGAVKSIDFAALEADAETGCATHVWAPPVALLYKATLVKGIGGFREDLPLIEDARFLFDAAYHGARFVHSPHIGARYRISPQSLSRRDPARFWRYVFLNGKQVEAVWRASGSLPRGRREALKRIYDGAARGLFAAADPEYFEAVASLRHLGGELPRHARIAEPLARALGLERARRLLRVIGR